MMVPAAIKELEKIEMTRQLDKVYRLDHAVTKTQNTILKAFVSVKQVPAKLTVKKSKKAVQVSWKSLPQASGYIIYRSTQKKAEYVQIAATTKTSYKDSKKLKKGIKYYYKVKAYILTQTGSVEYDSMADAKAIKYK